MNGQASTILVNAHVITLGRSRPRATAIAIRDGRVIAVGEERDVLEYRSARTEIADLGGRTVTPGLIDAHLHPGLGATRAIGVDFTGVTDQATALALLRTEADRLAREGTDGWVRAQNLDYELFRTLPMTAAAIEAAVRGMPALLFLFDGHTGLASREALARSGIDGPRSFDDASRIVVDALGAPTGELRGTTAIELVLAHAPVQTTAQTIVRVRQILAELSATGFTGGCIMDGNRESLDLLEQLDTSPGGLPLRLVTAVDHGAGDDEDKVRENLSLRDRRGARWRGGVVKLYADGVIDTGTGWLYEPDSDGAGLQSFWKDQAAFVRTIRRYNDEGFHIATHAIGDHAISATIDAYATAGSRLGPAAPHRIEHLECMADRDLSRMAAAGVTASVQPLHMQWRKADGSDAWTTRLGPERAARGWRVRDMIDHGILVALGSDWPVAQLDARIGMAWARLRRAPGRPDDVVFEPDQVLTALEALKGFTSWAAEAQGDHDVGRIHPGFRADLAIWEANPLAVTADELPDVPVHATLVDGRATHRSADSHIA
ncbi:amidohydrolase [Diaminobutyricibacter sp. McL0618]|uniref:amidohydrolase n=1 Tax=Leifsonia sp. McL0618 TaxID=3415677 RepID=UPI003CF0BA37